MTPNKPIRRPQRGDRLTTRLFGRLIDDLSAPAGVSGSAGGGFAEPAGVVMVVNTGFFAIAPLAVVALEQAFHQTEPDALNARVFSGQPAEDSAAVPMHCGIAAEAIAPGSVGRVYATGICGCRITDLTASRLQDGGGTILWQAEAEDSVTPRLAVVRFGAPPDRRRIARIHGGNAVQPGMSDGILYVDTAPASIPVYDPAALPSTVDGVGVAYDVERQEYVLVAHYAPAAVYARDLLGGSRPDLVLLGPTTTLPITDGDGAVATLYVVIGLV